MPGGSEPKWQSALRELNLALQSASQEDLGKIKSQLESALEDVAKRVKGGSVVAKRVSTKNPLVASMCSAAERATEGRVAADAFVELATGMTAKVKVQVDDWDLEKGVICSAKGDCSIIGKKYKLHMKATELNGKIAVGVIDILGLNIAASGERISDDTLGKSSTALEWATSIGVEICTAQDAWRAITCALEVLAKKNSKGIADIDILKVGFEHAKRALGVSNGEDGSKASRRRLTGKRSAMTPAATSKAEARMEMTEAEVSAACIKTELEGRFLKVRKVEKSDTPTATDAVAPSVSSQAASKAAEWQSPKDGAQPLGAAEVTKDQSDAADVAFEQLSDGGDGHDSESAEEQGDSQNDDEDEDDEQDAKVGADVDDGEDEGAGTAFASKSKLNSLQSKLETLTSPNTLITCEDIVAALDTDALDDDDELVPVNACKVFGDSFEMDMRASVAALVKKEGASKVAKLLLQNVEDPEDVVENQQDDGEDEEGEEEEELEEPEEEEAVSSDADECDGALSSKPLKKKSKRT